MQDPRLKIKEDLLHKLSWDHLLEEWKGEAEWPFWAVKPCLGLWKVQGASGELHGGLYSWVTAIWGELWPEK